VKTVGSSMLFEAHLHGAVFAGADEQPAIRRPAAGWVREKHHNKQLKWQLYEE